MTFSNISFAKLPQSQIEIDRAEVQELVNTEYSNLEKTKIFTIRTSEIHREDRKVVLNAEFGYENYMLRENIAEIRNRLRKDVFPRLCKELKELSAYSRGAEIQMLNRTSQGDVFLELLANQNSCK